MFLSYVNPHLKTEIYLRISAITFVVCSRCEPSRQWNVLVNHYLAPPISGAPTTRTVNIQWSLLFCVDRVLREMYFALRESTVQRMISASRRRNAD